MQGLQNVPSHPNTNYSVECKTLINLHNYYERVPPLICLGDVAQPPTSQPPRQPKVLHLFSLLFISNSLLRVIF